MRKTNPIGLDEISRSSILQNCSDIDSLSVYLSDHTQQYPHVTLNGCDPADYYLYKVLDAKIMNIVLPRNGGKWLAEDDPWQNDFDDKVCPDITTSIDEAMKFFGMIGTDYGITKIVPVQLRNKSSCLWKVYARGAYGNVTGVATNLALAIIKAAIYAKMCHQAMSGRKRNPDE